MAVRMDCLRLTLARLEAVLDGDLLSCRCENRLLQ